jgi:ribosomal protein S18 acetylase RimI-like enzyme
MEQDISLYEELQSNAFPALQTVMYDGWSVRFGGGFTYRVNCANPMYPERLPASEKLPYVEALYRQSGLSMSIFKLHEGMDPQQLQDCQKGLDDMGYGTERDGNIFVCDLGPFTRQPKTAVQVQTVMEDGWLDGFLTMNGTAPAQRVAAMTMLKNIYVPIAAASIVEDGKMVACGLGVLERGYVGLYDIYVDSSCRRRGLGADICTAIMQAGKAQGCHTAYLQVLSDNTGARALYRGLGYQETYEYWFRTRRFE